MVRRAARRRDGTHGTEAQLRCATQQVLMRQLCQSSPAQAPHQTPFMSISGETCSAFGVSCPPGLNKNVTLSPLHTLGATAHKYSEL